METFINQASALVKTASKLAKLQNSREEEKILRVAKAKMIETGYDNWNEGTTLFSLILEIPVELFSKIESSRGQLERSVRDRMGILTRADSRNSISEVIITPVLVVDSQEAENTEEEKTESVPSFWQQGYFRLFISHASAVKEGAHSLKQALAPFQVATFVAHDDIEPSLDWQTEIEGALRTMDALVAIVSPEFTSSKWCDQEVGFALGKGKFVLPLIKEATPYGFLGKIQGLQTKGLEVNDIAKKIIEVMLQNKLSSPRMTEVLVEKLVNSGSWGSSRLTMSLLEKTLRITPVQAGRLLRAIEENIDVGEAFTVPGKINQLIKRSS